MMCQTVQTPAGRAIVCGTRLRERCRCGRDATLLCDWKVPGKPSGTCDKPICTACTTSPATDKDLCRDHAEDYRAWLTVREKEKQA